jgi:hypothetical protein
MNRNSSIKRKLYYRSMYVLIKALKLKFYAAQDNNLVNGGYEFWSLKKSPHAYFYGTMKEFEHFHSTWRK